MVLMRLGHLDEARAHLEQELHNVTPGIGNQWAEPLAIRGLLRIAEQKNEAAPPELRRRLAAIEAEYRSAAEKDRRIGRRLAGAYRFVDPQAALAFAARLGPPENFREVLCLAVDHHLAGDDAGARRVLGEGHAARKWERQCEARMLSTLGE
jgi:hypothetical protein